MAENKLTDRTLRALKPAEQEQVLGDGGGLWVRVMPAAKGGAINFYYRFHHSGKEHRFNCGTYPETSLAAARQLRNTARADVRLGINPVEKLALAKEAAAAAIAIQRAEKTVDQLFEDWERVYLAQHQKNGGAFTKAAYDLDVSPSLGSLRARDIRLPHIVQVVDRIVERGARRKANLVLSLMRQMFRHGLGRGLVDTDPTLGLTKNQVGGKERPVQRNLSDSEIQELHRLLPGSGLNVRMQAGLWLILATGARVGELLRARWDHLDQETGTWLIPAENAKNQREHLIHLSEFAKHQITVIGALRAGPFLFPGQKPDSAISDKALTKAVRDRVRTTPLKKRTPKSASLLLSGGEWTPHDLRRTMASRMGDLGVEPHVIERCLNHVQQGIVGVYQRQEYLAERRDAFERWGAKLQDLTSPEDVNRSPT
ncbi:MAG: integrase [Comamonadaceae bacterium]|nr:integrase [Comamonadaceae bacterium]